MTTYRESGVDVGAAERLVTSISERVTATWGPDVKGPFGSFAAGVRLPPDVKSPVIMMTMDGVGTKLELARQIGAFGGVGFDLVAMCLDDLAAVGARPIGFSDYLAVGRIDAARDQTIIDSIAAACAEAGCPLLGGETAEHPGVLEPEQVDLAGAAFGLLEEGDEVLGGAIREGDVILGLHSPNVRSNGYSLVRKVVAGLDLNDPLPGMDRPAAEVLLEASVIYAPSVTRVLAAVSVNGLAHVTGGGLQRALLRILPEGCVARVEQGSWTTPSVFRALQELGSIDEAEMRRVFNLGVGFCIVLPPEAAPLALRLAAEHEPAIIGGIEAGDRSVDFR